MKKKKCIKSGIFIFSMKDKHNIVEIHTHEAKVLASWSSWPSEPGMVLLQVKNLQKYIDKNTYLRYSQDEVKNYHLKHM